MPDILAASNNLAGFPKNCYFSENMKRGEFGIASLYKHATLADSAGLSGLGNVKAFSDIVFDIFAIAGPTTNAVAAQDANGVIYTRNMGSNTWTEYYKPGHAAAAIGLLWDGRYFYYMGSERIGRADMGDMPSGYSDDAGTVSVTNGSPNVTGSGTNWNGAAQNGKRIKIGTAWYTVSNVASATSLTLTTNYTGATASGVAHRIFSKWTDAWNDCGSALTSYLNFQPFQFEGDILIPRQDDLCRFNRGDGSFNDDGDGIFDAPDGFYWRCGAPGPNGILFGLEPIHGNSSYLVLWDNFSDRAITSWIPLTSKVQAIEPYGGGWLVLTEREILFSTGYSVRVLSDGFEPKIAGNSFAVIPNGFKVLKDHALIANAIGGYTKKRSGIYVYDIKADTYDYIAPLGNHTYNVTPLAIHIDINKTINVSYATTIPSKKYLATISDDAAPSGYVVTKPLALDGNAKYLGAVRAALGIVEGADSISGSVTAKVASLNRRLWGYQKAKIAGVDTTHITVDGTALSDVQAGDEITVMEGANAGLVRHITNISGAGTSTEVWTLDEALTANIEQDAYVLVTPFKKIAKKTVTSATELRDMIFNAQNRYEGRQYLVKLAFAGLTVPIEVLEVGLIAQTQGSRT